MPRKSTDICQVEGCQEKAEFSLYRINIKGEKKWVRVCRLHEKHIGDANMKRAGGRYEI